jgi:hypothetical protein
MSSTHAKLDLDQRRTGIRRTVWIAGAAAVAMFVLFFVTQIAQH